MVKSKNKRKAIKIKRGKGWYASLMMCEGLHCTLIPTRPYTQNWA